MKNCDFSHSKREQGQSLIEMALFIPIITILMIGVFEVALLLRNYLICENAVRTAAIQASRGAEDEEIYRVLQENLGGTIQNSFLLFMVDPEQKKIIHRSKDGSVVKVGLSMRCGFYLPMMDYAASFRYPISVVRPVYQGARMDVVKPAYPADYLPWAIRKDSFFLGNEYMVIPHEGGASGNWRVVNFPGSSSSQYGQHLAGGYDKRLSVGDQLTVQKSNNELQKNEDVTRETLIGILMRMEEHLDESWMAYEDGNVSVEAKGLSSRVVLLPMISDFPDPTTAKEGVSIEGFGRFFLKGIYYADNGEPLDLSAGGAIFDKKQKLKTDSNGEISGLSSDRGIFYSVVYLDDGLYWYEKRDVNLASNETKE